MFNADCRTYDAVRKLWGLGRDGNKPLIVWVGAGASSWIGYERWAELAARFHRTFLITESRYERSEGAKALAQQDYPAVFQRCSDANPQRYYSLLSETLSPRVINPVYGRLSLLAALRQIEGVSILTTNIDEVLERSLSSFTLLQHSDLERAISLVTSRSPFIAKLHGSISSVRSAVFTTNDYKALIADAGFIHVLRCLLTTCSLVFIGYSLRDQYLFDLLQRNADLLSLFGGGPHFLVSAEDRSDLPPSVNIIQYLE